VDAALEFQHIQFRGEHDAQPLQPLGRVRNLEDLLAPLDIQFQERGNEVSQVARLLGVHRRNVGVLRNTMAQLYDLLEQGQHRPHQRVGGEARNECLLNGFYLSPKIGLRLSRAQQAHPTLSLYPDVDAAIGHAQLARDRDLCTDLVQVLDLGVLSVLIPLCNDDDARVGRLQSGLDGADRAVPSDEKRRDHVWENDRIAKGHDGELVRGIPLTFDVRLVIEPVVGQPCARRHLTCHMAVCLRVLL